MSFKGQSGNCPEEQQVKKTKLDFLIVIAQGHIVVSNNQKSLFGSKVQKMVAFQYNEKMKKIYKINNNNNNMKTHPFVTTKVLVTFSIKQNVGYNFNLILFLYLFFTFNINTEQKDLRHKIVKLLMFTQWVIAIIGNLPQPLSDHLLMRWLNTSKSAQYEPFSGV